MKLFNTILALSLLSLSATSHAQSALPKAWHAPIEKIMEDVHKLTQSPGSGSIEFAADYLENALNIVESSNLELTTEEIDKVEKQLTEFQNHWEKKIDEYVADSEAIEEKPAYEYELLIKIKEETDNPRARVILSNMYAPATRCLKTGGSLHGAGFGAFSAGIQGVTCRSTNGEVRRGGGISLGLGIGGGVGAMVNRRRECHASETGAIQTTTGRTTENIILGFGLQKNPPHVRTTGVGAGLLASQESTGDFNALPIKTFDEDYWRKLFEDPNKAVRGLLNKGSVKGYQNDECFHAGAVVEENTGIAPGIKQRSVAPPDFSRKEESSQSESID
jgi:hypothetical protein